MFLIIGSDNIKENKLSKIQVSTIEKLKHVIQFRLKKEKKEYIL